MHKILNCVSEDSISFGNLFEMLKPWLLKIGLVHSVYERGVKAVEWSPSRSQKASCLLNVLYDAVLECDSCESDQVNLICTFALGTQ